ncbi:MAG: hypothetical protein M3401_18785 [Actinomycetota bacterium]|nr:hypothetical protein [Actinomycetota bacterium]
MERLAVLLDGQVGRYRSLNGATSFRSYLEIPRSREDEEILTEPILAEILEALLGFPKDAYFSQLGRSGLKPDFTPIDLVAHRFVLDAKSSTQDLAPHEPQIRKYIVQRQLDLGVLFNLREVRVYRRGVAGHDAQLSFQLLPLWQAAKGEAMAPVEAARLEAFCGLFSHRAMGLVEKVDLVAAAEPWQLKLGRGERVDIDLEFLVSRLRLLSRTLAEDAAAQHQLLLDDFDFNPQHERRLRLELEVLAREIEPRADPADFPASASDYPSAGGLAGRAWRQYLMRVSQLTLIAVNRRELLPLRSVAPELRRVVKSPWRTHGVEVDPAAVAAQLPKAETISVRLDPALTLEIHSDGVTGRPSLDGDRLTFRHARKVTATIAGPAARLSVVATALSSTDAASELAAVLVPKDLTVLDSALNETRQAIEDGLVRGRVLVECLERLVCALYGLEPKLTELVIASAVTRAGTVAEADD